MNFRPRALVHRVAILAGAVCVLLSVQVSPVGAQTRLALEAGGLFPFSNMADTIDPSPLVGVRWEVQDVNALGKIALRSYFIRVGYSPLVTNGDTKAALGDSLQEEGNPFYWDVSLGLRAYGKPSMSPFFVSVSAGYGQYEAPGPSSSKGGLAAAAGGGVRIAMLGLILEGEVRAHGLFVEGDDLFFWSALAEVGIPF